VLLAQRQEILLEVLMLDDDYGDVYVVGMTEDGNNFGIFPNVFENPGQ
jgi:hypothetical protein